MNYEFHTPLSAVTATTTSHEIDILGAKRVTFAFTRADHSSGSSAFKVQVSLDGATFVDFNGLIEDLTNTNAQDSVRATTITLSADGTKVASMDLERHCVRKMKVVVTETTDGTHSCKAVVER